MAFGIRIGPRIAHVRVSTRGIGVGSGIGPFSAYAGTSYHSRIRSRGGSYSDYEQEQRRTDREQEIAHVAELNEQFTALWHAHLITFPPAERPMAPMVEPVDLHALVKSSKHAAFASIPWYKRAARHAAADAATTQAAVEAEATLVRRRAEAQALQDDLDRRWNLLIDNDPEAVLDTVAHALEDHGVTATPIDYDGEELAVVLTIGDPELLVPSRYPDVTPTGRPTIHKRTKTDTNHEYALLLTSQAIAMAKLALAVAPTIARVAFVVIRDDQEYYLTALCYGRVTREWATAFDWSNLFETDALRSVEWTLSTVGRTDEVAPLDLHDEPHILELMDQVATKYDRVLNPACLPAGRNYPSQHTTDNSDESQKADETVGSGHARTTRREDAEPRPDPPDADDEAADKGADCANPGHGNVLSTANPAKALPTAPTAATPGKLPSEAAVAAATGDIDPAVSATVAVPARPQSPNQTPPPQDDIPLTSSEGAGELAQSRGRPRGPTSPPPVRPRAVVPRSPPVRPPRQINWSAVIKLILLLWAICALLYYAKVI
jgi:hypothetical protein